jgi:hypothetical protein
VSSRNHPCWGYQTSLIQGKHHSICQVIAVSCSVSTILYTLQFWVSFLIAMAKI